MTFFQLSAALVTVAALAAYLNHRWVRLPATIGLMAVSLVLSLALVALGHTGLIDLAPAADLVRGVDLSAVLLHGMLAFLLFAGALHVDLEALGKERLVVAVLSTVGVAIATIATGGLLFIAASWIGLDLPLPWALVFGALISPTDPIAVLGILRQAGAPRSLESQLIGESLFNDGIGVVVFLALFDFAQHGTHDGVGWIAALLIFQCAAAVGLGLALGWVTYRLLRTVDAYPVETLLTLALAMGGYAAAEELRVSAPITVVVAGLVIGNHGRAFAMSAKTRQHLDSFWELTDEILNAVLFVLLGLELIPQTLNVRHFLAGLLAVLIVLCARVLSVGLSATLIRPRRRLDRSALAILVWGGLRGGISIALSLSLPPGPAKDLIVPVTYAVVVFSVLGQGLTLGRVVRWLAR